MLLFKYDLHLFAFSLLYFLDTEKIELWNNQFVGTISTQFGNLPQLDTLDLHGNFFDSKIPETICNVGSILKLDLSINTYIHGSIPDSLRNCSNMSEFMCFFRS